MDKEPAKSYVPKPDICSICGGHIVGVEYSLLDPCHYDGISEWACENALGENPTCRYRIGRFCGKPLGSKEQEPRYCRGEVHVVHA